MALIFLRGKLGGGGWIMDIIWSPDGLTGIIRTDVYCAWIWEPLEGTSGEWKPLVTATSMPSGVAKLGNNGVGWGCYAIDVARSNSSIIYMVSPSLGGSNSTVYKSTDRGTTFTATGLTPMVMSVQDTYRMYGKKMMIHPTDPDIVLVTNNAGDLWRTSDGGTSWTEITVPSGDDPCIQFNLDDPTIVYMGWRTGDNRLYRSTDTGATFSQMTGGPDNLRRLTCGTNGKAYMTEEGVTGNVWRLVGTTFTNLTMSDNTRDYHTVAVSPVNPDRVTVQFGAGNIDTSLDGGDTWGGIYANAAVRESSADIQWLEWTNEDSMSSGDIAYDPITEDKLWFAEGIGVWYTTPPLDNAQPTWTSQTRGQEELIVNDMRWPPGSRPFLVTQDRGIFRLDDFEVYPSTHGPGRTVPLQHSFGLEYARSDPDYLAGASYGGPANYYTTDGGDTYAAFSPQPTTVGGGFGGCFAVLTPLNMIYCGNANGQPVYTTDGGATWTLCTFPGDVPTTIGDPFNPSGWGNSVYDNQKYITADHVTSTYYAYNYVTRDTYKSTDGGANFTKTADNVMGPGIGIGQAIIAVPGQAGHAFLTSGSVYNEYPLKRSKNAADASATWTEVANTQVAWRLACCAPAPGQSYPAILLAGKANGDTEYGIYMSIDDCATWVLQTRAPANELDIVHCMTGNPDTYGEFIFGGAAGYFYTQAPREGGGRLRLR